jgi:serine/threonine-protein kinase
MSDCAYTVFAPYPESGTLLGGKYRIERVLGEGGMGVVMLATHVDLERLVAIKILRPEYAARDEIVMRMLFEARAAARLRNEHIVRVLDVARLDTGAPYIVLEYLEGYDLGAYLVENGTLPVAQAVDCILQACEALAEAHALGLVHRDLKPENLFVTSGPAGSWHIKVLDFGVSKDTRRDAEPRSTITNPSSAVGSPHYMAPEQMLVQPDLDCRADIWSLGAILFELISGRSPFEAQSLPSVCGLVLEGQPKRLKELCPEVPGELDDIISRCLSKDRNGRFPDVSSLAAALAAWGGPTARPQAERVSVVEADAAVRRPTPMLGSPRMSPPPISLQPTTRTPSAHQLSIKPRKPRRFATLRTLALVGVVSAAAGFALMTPLASQGAAQATTQPAPMPDEPLPLPQRHDSHAFSRVQASTAVPELESTPVQAEPVKRSKPRRQPRDEAADEVSEPEHEDSGETSAAIDPFNPENFGGRR